jgi:ABC-type proline/glycine betaine transport system permease subunit
VACGQMTACGTVRSVQVALKVLPIAGQHPAQLYLASFLVLLGLGALAVSMWSSIPASPPPLRRTYLQTLPPSCS